MKNQKQTGAADSAQLVNLAAYRAALQRLNECRAACPGVGGDVDAMNLRAMIERREVSHSTALQAARTLSHLTIALGIDARAEICALRAIPALLEVLDAAEYVSEAPKAGIELTSEDRAVFAARIAAARELLTQAE